MTDCSFQLFFLLQDLHNLSLMLPQETVTFRRHNAQSTIDHIFSASSLSRTLMTCCSNEDLAHGSDHYPLENSILFSPHVPIPLKRKTDKAALSPSAGDLDQFPKDFQNCKDIDAGVDQLVR